LFPISGRKLTAAPFRKGWCLAGHPLEANRQVFERDTPGTGRGKNSWTNLAARDQQDKRWIRGHGFPATTEELWGSWANKGKTSKTGSKQAGPRASGLTSVVPGLRRWVKKNTLCLLPLNWRSWGADPATAGFPGTAAPPSSRLPPSLRSGPLSALEARHLAVHGAAAGRPAIL